MLLTAADLTTTTWRDTAESFKLVGGGFEWVDAERVGRLIRLTRIAQTQAGPKVVQYFVNPNQLVTVTRSVSHG